MTQCIPVLKFCCTVFKEPILFSSSIADNIAYGASTSQQVSSDDIMDAAVQANAYGFIKSFPKGFDTIVGERGQMLSGWRFANPILLQLQLLHTHNKLFVFKSSSTILTCNSCYRLCERFTSS